MDNINFDDYDGILVFDGDWKTLCEGINDPIPGGPGDVRTLSASIGPTQDKGAYSQYIDYQDPKLFASWSFGNQIRNNLGNVGYGYGCEVADYGRYVSVKVTYSNPPTGKTASKTFLVVFEPDGKKGYVFQTSNRYRTFSGVSQAASYIKSATSSLRSATQ